MSLALSALLVLSAQGLLVADAAKKPVKVFYGNDSKKGIDGWMDSEESGSSLASSSGLTFFSLCNVVLK